MLRCTHVYGAVHEPSVSPSLRLLCTPALPVPQKEDARKAAAAAAAAASSQPPYLLKLAKKNSYGSGVSTYG